MAEEEEAVEARRINKEKVSASGTVCVSAWCGLARSLPSAIKFENRDNAFFSLSICKSSLPYQILLFAEIVYFSNLNPLLLTECSTRKRFDHLFLSTLSSCQRLSFSNAK